MTLARDEKLGLAIASLAVVAALATFGYRQTWSTAPAEPAPPPSPEVANDQAARADYAIELAEAFAADHNAAEVTADGTMLRVKWEMCSKQMLQRLLHDDQNLQVKAIRAASGLSVKRLKSHGIRVNALCMDATDSEMVRFAAGAAATPEVVAQWMRPEQMGGLVLDLLAEGRDGRTGENIGAWMGHKVELPERRGVLPSRHG